MSPARLLCLVAIMLSGCAGAVHTVEPATEADRLAWANRLFAERPATVVLADGRRQPVESLRVAPDTTTWIDPATREIIAVSTFEIEAVEQQNPARSSRRLMRRGAVVGAVAIGLLGVVTGYDAGTCLYWCSEPTGGERLGGALIFGAAGAVTGVPLGLWGGAVASVPSDKTERFVLGPFPPLEARANEPAVSNRAP